MTKSKSPSTLWSKEHGRKIAHATRDDARSHADSLNDRFRHLDQVWRPYPCRWTDDHRDGRTGPEHWHAGRIPQ